MLVERIDTEHQAVTRITRTPPGEAVLVDEANMADNGTDTALLWRPRTARGPSATASTTRSGGTWESLD